MGNPRGSGGAARVAASQSAYWLELLVESGVVSVEKLAPLRQEWSERKQSDIDASPKGRAIRERVNAKS